MRKRKKLKRRARQNWCRLSYGRIAKVNLRLRGRTIEIVDYKMRGDGSWIHRKIPKKPTHPRNRYLFRWNRGKLYNRTYTTMSAARTSFARIYDEYLRAGWKPAK